MHKRDRIVCVHKVVKEVDKFCIKCIDIDLEYRKPSNYTTSAVTCRTSWKASKLTKFDSPHGAPPQYTDNSRALQLAKNPVFHERTKHIAVRYYYIRDFIKYGIIELVYILTEDQKANGLTKPLGWKLFKSYLEHLGLN
jgi:hypothetical protein